MIAEGDRSGGRLIALAVFVSGMTTLGVELTASRLLGNVFGTSNIVWANIIGLILVYLTAGYFIGGRWADRSPFSGTFYRLLAWGAFFAGIVPLVARPVLRLAASSVESLDTTVMLGSFLGVLVLFSVPVTLLGCVSPFAIRLALRQTDQAGTVSGKLYAISTLGSILGTFLPVLWLIPTIGTARWSDSSRARACASILFNCWTSSTGTNSAKSCSSTAHSSSHSRGASAARPRLSIAPVSTSSIPAWKNNSANLPPNDGSAPCLCRDSACQRPKTASSAGSSTRAL